MPAIPTKLMLPLPEFLTREYMESGVTTRELFGRQDFVRFMLGCDGLVATSENAKWYHDLFTILMVHGRFLFPADPDFSTALTHAREFPVTAAMLERGVEACLAVNGPNEVLSNVFVGYEFFTSARLFTRSTANYLRRMGRKVSARLNRLGEGLDQRGTMLFLIALRTQLGIDAPDNWQQPLSGSSALTDLNPS